MNCINPINFCQLDGQELKLTGDIPTALPLSEAEQVSAFCCSGSSWGGHLLSCRKEALVRRELCTPSMCCCSQLCLCQMAPVICGSLCLSHHRKPWNSFKIFHRRNGQLLLDMCKFAMVWWESQSSTLIGFGHADNKKCPWSCDHNIHPHTTDPHPRNDLRPYLALLGPLPYYYFYHY